MLAAIGLMEIMTEKDYIDPFNKDHFDRYTPKDYLDSSRKEMDEVYRMSEVVLLHKATGLRVECLTTENYMGDELRYRVKDVFILTNRGQRVGVTAVDFNKHILHTTEGLIPFEKVEK